MTRHHYLSEPREQLLAVEKADMESQGLVPGSDFGFENPSPFFGLHKHGRKPIQYQFGIRTVSASGGEHAQKGEFYRLASVGVWLPARCPVISNFTTSCERERNLYMLNRDLLIISYKQSFVDWINEADPNPDGSLITLEQANEDSPAYLIHEDASEDFEHYLRECYLPLFENVLHEWYTDPDVWPQDRSLECFKNWCDFRLHSLIQDCVDGPLLDDELE